MIDNLTYESPVVEILEIEAEKGFASSQNLEKYDWKWE